MNVNARQKNVRIAVHLLHVGFRQRPARVLYRHQSVASV